ncbi:protein O-mannosyl-transferase [Candidatus Magnetomoraceae bacterium gMMP-13]
MKIKQSVFYLSAILLLSIFVFSNTIDNGFVNLDDNEYIYDNNYIHDFSINGIKNLFLKKHHNPLTKLSFLINYHLWGFNAKTYHIINLIIHLFNIALVFYFISLFTDKIEIIVITALFFAIHPMRVESVAWISERKDLLYSFFYLISLINYFYYVKNKSKTAFIISVLLFELSYLSKGVAISLPFVLFAIDYYFERKLTPRLIFEKLIFIIIAFSPKIFKYLIKLELSRIEISIAIAVTLLLCIITFIGIKKLKNQSDIIYSYIFGSIFSGIVFLFLFKKLIKLVPAIDVSFFDRILMANYSLLFYIVKLFLPVNLSALHYYPKKTDGFLPIEYYIAPFIIILLVFLIFKGMKYSDQKLRKNIIFGLLLFLIPISITLHIIPIKGKVIVAERYTYMPYIGLFFIIGSFYLRAENIKKYLLVLLIGYTASFIYV